MSCSEEIKKLKNSLVLDFNQLPSPKKLKSSNLIDRSISKNSNNNNKRCYLLTTPDVEKLALTTPEIADLLQKTSNYPSLPTFTRNDDTDDEKPNKQFLEMWSQASKNISNNNNNSKTGATPTKESRNDNRPINRSNTSNPVQPINMEDQEQAKLERKRLRNRIAASKCRQRKMERISNLRAKVNEYTNKNDQLAGWISVLKEVNNKLRMHTIKHREMGCDIAMV